MSIEAMTGETLVAIEGMVVDSDEVMFRTASGRVFRMYHEQDCCEGVAINDVTGNVTDLLDTPLLVAREDTNYTTDDAPEGPDSFTWTFYNFSTIRGHVTLRWLGESSGYYGESVDVKEEVT